MPGLAPWEREWIDSPRWVRARFGETWVASSKRMKLLRQHGFLPVYYFPSEDVRTDLLVPSDHVTESPYKGVASYWDVVVGDRVAPAAAWSYLDPKPGSPDTRGYFSFDWHSLDAWYEESERIYVHARDPYLRADALLSRRGSGSRSPGRPSPTPAGRCSSSRPASSRGTTCRPRTSAWISWSRARRTRSARTRDAPATTT